MIVAQWVQYARLVRGSVLSLRDREFILSARAIGVGNGRIIFTHILPNVLGPIVILMTLNVANNILLESSLTFLGLGVDPLIPSWGGMLADGRTYLQIGLVGQRLPGACHHVHRARPQSARRLAARLSRSDRTDFEDDDLARRADSAHARHPRARLGDGEPSRRTLEAWLFEDEAARRDAEQRLAAGRRRGARLAAPTSRSSMPFSKRSTLSVWRASPCAIRCMPRRVRCASCRRPIRWRPCSRRRDAFRARRRRT